MKRNSKIGKKIDNFGQICYHGGVKIANYGLGSENQFAGFSLRISDGAHCCFHTVLTNHPHWHEDFWELCLITKGTGAYSHGPKRFSLKRGDVIVADPQVVHEISSWQSRDLSLVFFRLMISNNKTGSGSRPIESRIMASFIKGHAPWRSGGEKLLAYLPLLTPRAFGKGDSRFFASRRNVCSMVLEALNHLSRRPSDEALKEGAYTSLLKRALEYIDAHIGQKLSVAALAAGVGVSPRNLRRHCARVLRKRAIDLVQERKMDRAASLLAMNWRVKEVAFHLGYDDPAQFSRLFKTVFKLSPKAYARANFREKLPRTLFL